MQDDARNQLPLALNAMLHLFDPNTRVPPIIKEIVWLILGTVALAFLALEVPSPIWT